MPKYISKRSKEDNSTRQPPCPAQMRRGLERHLPLARCACRARLTGTSPFCGGEADRTLRGVRQTRVLLRLLQDGLLQALPTGPGAGRVAEAYRPPPRLETVLAPVRAEPHSPVRSHPGNTSTTVLGASQRSPSAAPASALPTLPPYLHGLHPPHQPHTPRAAPAAAFPLPPRCTAPLQHPQHPEPAPQPRTRLRGRRLPGSVHATHDGDGSRESGAAELAQEGAGRAPPPANPCALRTAPRQAPPGPALPPGGGSR